MNINLKTIGSFAKTLEYLKRISGMDIYLKLVKYGEKGVNALSAATPVRTGKTAASWSYKIERTNSGYNLSWLNSNESEGVPIVILIRYGHITASGFHVPANDFVRPIIEPLYDEIANDIWGEVTK